MLLIVNMLTGTGDLWTWSQSQNYFHLAIGEGQCTASCRSGTQFFSPEGQVLTVNSDDS